MSPPQGFKSLTGLSLHLSGPFFSISVSSWYSHDRRRVLLFVAKSIFHPGAAYDTVMAIIEGQLTVALRIIRSDMWMLMMKTGRRNRSILGGSR